MAVLAGDSLQSEGPLSVNFCGPGWNGTPAQRGVDRSTSLNLHFDTAPHQGLPGVAVPRLLCAQVWTICRSVKSRSNTCYQARHPVGTVSG